MTSRERFIQFLDREGVPYSDMPKSGTDITGLHIAEMDVDTASAVLSFHAWKSASYITVGQTHFLFSAGGDFLGIELDESGTFKPRRT